jgi:hypothetical protein
LDNTEVIQLSPETIMQYWEVIDKAISSALVYSMEEADSYSYLRKFSDNTYQCWAVVNSDKKIINVTVTKVNHYDKHKSLHLLLTSSVGNSKWEEYKEAHHAIEQYARKQGCKRIEMYGRKGWSRVLDKLTGSKNEKYKQVYVVHSMELKNEQ